MATRSRWLLLWGLLSCAAEPPVPEAPPRCTDQQRNGAETDVDCGGACGPCPVSGGCAVAADCQSRVCTNQRCAAPSCADGVKNGAEIDVDCGGEPPCPRCASGRSCRDNNDCSGACVSGRCVDVPTPRITELTPADGGTTGYTTTTIRGSGFEAGRALQVTFGDALAVSVQFVSDTELQAVTPARAERFGRVDVTVQNPSGRKGTKVGGFLYHSLVASFSDAASVTGVDNLYQAVLADLDKDGRLDLIQGRHVNVRAIALRRGMDGGAFDAPVNMNLPTGIYYPTVADLNGDGRLDIAGGQWTSEQAKSLVVLYGKGDGTFEDPRYFAAGEYVLALALADFNGDGKPDLAALNYYAEKIQVLLNQGDGGFVSGGPFATVSRANYLVAGDINGDSAPDLIVTSETQPVLTLHVNGNQGNGAFPAAPSTLALGPAGMISGAVHVAAADLNGDGALDLVTPNINSKNLSVLLNRNQPGAVGFADPQVIGTGDRPRWVTLVDVDGDERVDLLSAEQDARVVAVRPGRGDGTFRVARNHPMPGCNGFSIAVADLDKDSRPDLVVPCENQGFFYAYYNESR